MNYNHNDLCLACSSSLVPSTWESVFKTTCCHRPICHPCVSSNPRLARYDPCLACLSGVGALVKRGDGKFNQVQASKNVDGAVKDEDVFIVGDDEEETEQPTPSVDLAVHPSSSNRPINDRSMPDSIRGSTSPPPVESALPSAAPVKYYVQKGDTLHGIALRFGLDGRELCQLNKLPPSTLTTTPHILHTRIFLTLPRSSATENMPQETEADKERRARERAKKQLQTLTKEVDYRVAQAYVALAEGSEEDGDKWKENGEPGRHRTLESVAVEMYLDDQEWEEAQMRERRGVEIQRFPYTSWGANTGIEKDIPSPSFSSRVFSWWSHT